MPRDQRLYMTFPNDFHRHPKVSRLSDAEFRAFVEMNGEARIADNDGVFPAEEAAFLWPQAVIDALVASHPTRPLVLREGTQYVIRDYAEHQQTREERARLAEKNRVNGSKGGRPRKNPTETQSDTTGNPEEPNVTQTKAEIETELEINNSPSNEGELLPRKRGTRIPEPFMVTGEMRAWAAENVPGLNVDLSTQKFTNYWRAKAGRDAAKLDWPATWRNWLLNDHERSVLPGPLRKKTAAERALELTQKLRGENDASGSDVRALDRPGSS